MVKQRESHQSPLILIIEDDRSLSNMYAHKLNLGGYRTVIANDGKVGMQIAKNQRPNLILLDMLLPEKKGEEIAKKINSNKKLKNIPIIVLSNLADNKSFEHTKKYGVKEYLLKPMYSPDQVLRIAQKYL